MFTIEEMRFVFLFGIAIGICAVALVDYIAKRRR